MLGDISGAANIYIITGYTDMRKSLDGLYAIVMDQLGEEPKLRRASASSFAVISFPAIKKLGVCETPEPA